MKAHKGMILNVTKRYYSDPTDKHLGYYYFCRFVDHPVFAGERGHTSLVVHENGDEIETLNSRYTIGSRQ